MKSFELLLTVLFIIIIYMAVGQKIESSLVIGITSICVVILCIGCDYNKAIDNTIETCGIKRIKSPKRKEIEKKIIIQKQVETFDDTDIAKIDDVKVDGTDISKIKEDTKETELITKKVLKAGDELVIANPSDGVIKQLSKRPMKLEYSENNYKKNLFDEIGSLGDNKIAHLMKHVSNKNRVAIDNMSRQNKYTNIKYFEQELKDHANSVWWDDETLEKEF
jgi:hypothetical protein